MTEDEKRDERAEEAELKRPDEEVKDLEPDEEGKDVKGGGGIKQKFTTSAD